MTTTSPHSAESVARPTCRDTKELAFWLVDLMSRCDEGPDSWDAADKVAFARSVYALFPDRSWASRDLDRRFAELLPGYAEDDGENPDAGFEVFDGSDFQQEVSRA